MEITTEQIRQVEVYLQNKDFDFIDLKVEVLDHMISDIESLLTKKYSFEDAYRTTVLKWEKYFKETSSFYFGFQYHESKIVVKKAIKIFKPFYFLYLAAYFLPVAFLKLVPIQVAEDTADFINAFLVSSAAILLAYLLMIVIKTKQSKVKTTYRFILKTQYLSVVLLVLGVFLGTVFNDEGEMNAVFTGFTSGGFAVVFICYYFFKKHEEAVNTYRIS
jgi:hypothetical protein|tara:strand:- start:596 stop:1249 length:654 start_codon:yes stop_codon:yes gene_type:complete